MVMDCGQRLFGFLELGGAVLFTTGLAVRAVIQRLSSNSQTATPSISGNKVLILGANKNLGYELVRQFNERGCTVAYAAPYRQPHGVECAYFRCDPSDPKQLDDLSLNVQRNFGELDILVYASGEAKSVFYKEAIDEVVDMMDKNLMEHFHVVTKFVPRLSKRSGRFVTIEPQKKHSRSFSVTSVAMSALSDTLLQQLAQSNGNNGVRVTRALRRTHRRYDRENVEESAAAILNAIETGRSSVTLPTVKQHIKNVLRHVFNEVRQLCYETTRLHKLVA